jgi:signal transduction histidine kinase
MIGYAIVILLLGAGLLFMLHRANAVTTAALERIRQEERETMLAERLRWSAEVIVSSGRGYLVSGDRELLEKLRAASARFEQYVGELREAALDSAAVALLDHVELAAAQYSRVQREVLSVSQLEADSRELIARRFRSELWPDQRSLARALDRFMAHKDAAIATHYAAAARQHSHVMGWAWFSLVALVAVAFVVARYFARLLSQGYEREHNAVQSAQRASAARDELMAIVAHDLRSPLGAITMNAGVLAASAESDATRRRAATIEHIAIRMAHLITSMLDAAVLEAGRLTIHPTACDVESLLQDALQLHQASADAKRVCLEHRVDVDGLEVYADRERTLQVLSNLIGNALKFTPERGRVRVSAERHGGAVRFAVRDTGAGIAAADLPHVFERFWKHETRHHAGAGLGLFIAKSLVDAHGGRIWVENAAGGGADFYFTLPSMADVQRGTASVPSWQTSGADREQ